MEKLLANIASTIRLKILNLYDVIVDLYINIVLQSHYFFQFLIFRFSSKTPGAVKSKDYFCEENQVSQGDVMVVMDRLGLIDHYRPSGGNDNSNDYLREIYDASELSRLFEQEPSLDEVKEAFDVFDVNKDGFIDANDLQRVLCCCFGLKEGSQLDKCRKMIKAAKIDIGDDEKILDFNDFVIFLERCFC